MPRSALRGPRGFLAVAAVAATTAAVAFTRAADVDPQPIDQATVQIVAMILQRGHLARPTINDEISKKWVNNYIKSLDPRKYFFLKADVDEFHKYDTKLDETIGDGDLSFAKLVMDRFQKRAEERGAEAAEILKVMPDFTLDEVLVDADQLDYPATADEAKDRLRKYIKLELLGKRLAKKSDADALKEVAITYKDMHRAFRQFDNVDLLERYLTALTMSIDPHSNYMGAKEYEDMMNQRLHLSLEGIGAVLQTIDGYPTVQEVVPGGAADKDGRLQLDDKIVGVELEDGTRETFVEKKLSDVVRKIRGPAASKVKLVVIPAETNKEQVYELTRARIDLASDKAKGKVIESVPPEGGPARKIGILNVPSFYGDTQAVNQGEPDAVSVTKDCRKILDDFKKQGVQAVVVDVRGDPGGLLEEAISLSGLFIDKGPIVQVRQGQGVSHRDDEDAGTAWDGPLVVVLDHFSASASEIFAGAIKDYGRGLVVGDSSSFGKGSVQNVVDIKERLRLRNNEQIPPLGALKLTIQQFYLPNGDSTQIKGVTPHLHIPSVNDYFDSGESRYDTALKFDKVPAVPHDSYNRVPSELLDRIREKSEARRKANPKFQEEEKYIAKAAERKTKHQVTLNEARFRAENKIEDKGDDDKSKPKSKTKRTRKPENIWENEYYNDEVAAIVNDYLTLGTRVLIAEPVKAAQANAGRAPQRP